MSLQVVLLNSQIYIFIYLLLFFFGKGGDKKNALFVFFQKGLNINKSKYNIKY